MFTIASIALAGLGLEGMLLAVFLWLASGDHSAPFPLATTTLGLAGIVIAALWRRHGVRYLHYTDYDGVPFFDQNKDGNDASQVLHNLIEEDEHSIGFARSDVRARAKEWLIGHATALDEEDILLARAHFGYLLPAGWGLVRSS